MRSIDLPDVLEYNQQRVLLWVGGPIAAFAPVA